ncbi:MAG: hypothetical protein L0207_03295 [Chlamydiae bacterium]|nr:hypothetical protein [Chlamydiota bacterium]
MDAVKIRRIGWKPFTLSFRQLKRRGLLLHLESETGKETLGEISPLPSFSRENLDQAENQLKMFQSQILKTDWTEKKIKELEQILYPSVAFGLQNALWDILTPMDSISCSIAAFFWGTFDQILKDAEQAKIKGYKTAKLKVGNLSHKEVKLLIDLLKKTFTLRIDFNRKWKPTEIFSLLSQYRSSDFEYIEEPALHKKEFSAFNFPFALDETARENSIAKFFSHPFFYAIIFKPMISKISPFLDKRVILGSSYESGIGTAHIVRLAKRLKLDHFVLGLGPYEFLEKDLLQERLKIEEGKMTIPAQLNV